MTSKRYLVNPWTQAQEEVLRKNWATVATPEAMLRMVNDAGPRHGMSAMYGHAKRNLGLTRPKRGTISKLVHGRGKKVREAAAQRIQDPPLQGLRTEIRNGQKITICPPAYAWGAYRADRPHLGYGAYRTVSD